MTTLFRKRIRQSIADESLQSALDANAERRLTGRINAFASLPDHTERRQRAHAIKADVVAHLDEYLAQFIANVEKNGILVHRAADGDEAVEQVLEIINDSQRRHEGTNPLVSSCLGGQQPLVAKSKSMVSEEIELNHALEANGIRVVETDLGEYIVQLRGERPSHIITPAVHLRRGDVGRLFAEKLGIPYTEDIPTLTDTARKILREVFLTADIGVSGVNFGVAETGTLCIVTNEGNGRMVTTMPPVHVALMGIERLVPTLDDLALFLSLLPRSATGQKLSVYTSLIHSPKRQNDPDGPQERHLILLDNGRSAIRHSPLAEALYCIRCGACLNACPVFREISGHAYGSIYPGPIGAVISGALVDPKFAYLSQASSLCGACKEACPVDIDLPGLLLRVRSEQPAGGRMRGAAIPIAVRWGLQAFRRVAVHPGLFALAQRMAGLAMLPKWIRLPAFTGWGYSKDFPRLAARPFRARWGKIKQVVEEKSVRPQESLKFSEPTTQPPHKPLSDQFAEELVALGGQAYLVSEKELPTRLAEFLKSKGIDRVLVGDVVARYIVPLPEGIDIVREPDASTWLSASPTVRAGVTGALAGIAESGSLVLASGAGYPLTASLLPKIHIAILHIRDLHENLAQALKLREVRESSAAVLITGPSRTADIEMTLTIGVHGPGELHVFLIDDSETV